MCQAIAMEPPVIIAVEGIDGSGKTTFCAALAERLGIGILKFPNKETASGRKLYSMLADGSARAEPMLFQALQAVNRYEVAGELQGESLILDRYWLSSVAYGAAAGLDRDWLVQINELLPQPTMWVYLDLDPAESFRRRPERRDSFEGDLSFTRRAAHEYLRTIASMVESTLCLDASLPTENLVEQVVLHLQLMK